MTGARGLGEPISRGRSERRTADAAALRRTLLTVSLLTGVVLVNGLLVILGIELFEALGIWPTPADRSSAP